MSEGEPPQHKGKFDSDIDAALYELSLHGWANESSGNVEAPTGWFGRVSISREELPEIAEAFEEEFRREGFTELAGLIGHFLVREDSVGFVYVDEFDGEDEAKEEYERLDREYSEWEGADE